MRDIVQALTTEGVKPAIIINIIKNIVVIVLIFRFETFILFRIVVIPIIIKPHMSARNG